MSQLIPVPAKFLAFLLRIDAELADEAREKGCSCGGVLHCANYPRKPRGGPERLDLDPDASLRFSFCCAKDGCRQRMTPSSVRFLGPKLYLGAVVILACAMRQGPSPIAARKLHELVGVDRHTLVRWQVWWREMFATSLFFKGAAGRFKSPVDHDLLPLSLLERFRRPTERKRLVRFLRFIAPITTSAGLSARAA